MVAGASGEKTAGSKVIVSPGCAFSNAWRSVPGPLSDGLVTEIVTPSGIGADVVGVGVRVAIAAGESLGGISETPVAVGVGVHAANNVMKRKKAAARFFMILLSLLSKADRK